MAIPKIIHYVWLGGGEKPKDIKICMKSWERHLSDYKIIHWSEENFDINANRFIKQAYEQKKYAYVSDYIRLYALYNYGGIYLDTDVIVMNDLTKLLENRAFIGFENKESISAAIIGAEKGHPFIKEFMDYYEDRDFEYDPKNPMASVNTHVVTNILKNSYGCKMNNTQQTLKEGIVVYPEDVLSNPSDNSNTIHIFTGTWLDGKSEFKKKIVTFLKVHIKGKKSLKLYKLIRKIA